MFNVIKRHELKARASWVVGEVIYYNFLSQNCSDFAQDVIMRGFVMGSQNVNDMYVYSKIYTRSFGAHPEQWYFGDNGTVDNPYTITDEEQGMMDLIEELNGMGAPEKYEYIEPQDYTNPINLGVNNDPIIITN